MHFIPPVRTFVKTKVQTKEPVFNNKSLDISKMCDTVGFRVKEHSQNQKDKMKNENDNESTNNNQLNSIQNMEVMTPSLDGVIKIQFTKNQSPTTLDVVTIQDVGTESSVNQDLVVVPPREQTDPKMVELIHKIKMVVTSMGENEKELVHWKKRVFESALKVGEYLVSIRMTFGKDKVGFRKFVETEFSNQFCYKTAQRYMKVYNKRSEIPNDVCTLRGAYLSVGILKEEYLDTDEKQENTSVNTLPVTPQQSKPKQTKEKTSVSFEKKKLYDHPNSILLGHYRLNSPNGLFQLEVNPDGRLLGVNVEDDSRMGGTKPEFEDIVFERLKPFVEWYNIKNQKKKEIEFYSNTVYELDKAA